MLDIKTIPTQHGFKTTVYQFSSNFDKELQIVVYAQMHAALVIMTPHSDCKPPKKNYCDSA